MKAGKKFKLSAIFVFLFILLVTIYFSIAKTGFHMDELLSYGLANNFFEPFPYDGGEWLPANYYQNYLIPTTEGQFAYDSVVYNQIQDVHPPIYYILLHTISSFFPNVFSKWIGLSLNIIIHLFSTVVLYKVTKEITNDGWVSLITVLFWGASIGALSSVLFIRMYTLLTFANILLIYLTLKFIKHEKPINIFLLLIFLVIIFGGLTQYYFFIFAFFATVTVFLILISKKSFIKSFLYPIVALFSVICSFLIYPAINDHIMGTNRGNEVIQNSSTGFNLESLNTFIEFIYEHLFGDFTLLLLLIVILSLLLVISKFILDKNSVNKSSNITRESIEYFIIIFIPSALYLITVQQLSGYKVSRYIYAIYPFIALSFILFLWLTLNYISSRKLLNKIIIFIISFIFVITGLFNVEPDHLYKEAEQPQQISKSLSDLNAVVLLENGERWRINQHINALRHYDRVYPMLLSNMNELPEDKIINNSNYLVINITSNLDSKEARNKIENHYNFNDNDLLYSHHSYNAYLFKNN